MMISREDRLVERVNALENTISTLMKELSKDINYLSVVIPDSGVIEEVIDSMSEMRDLCFDVLAMGSDEDFGIMKPITLADEATDRVLALLREHGRVAPQEPKPTDD